jgi:hypothetical protein
VVAENTGGPTRYRLLETVRQYALEKLGESGEADAMRSRHRDHYTAMAALLDASARSDYDQRVGQADEEMDNLRSAFGWSIEIGDVGRSLQLATSLQPLWFTRGRIREGLAWFDAALTGGDAHHFEVADAVRAGALADKAVLDAWVAVKFSMDQAQQALAIAREVDDPALLARALTACGVVAGYYDREVARPYFDEAIRLARAISDRWRLSQILALQAQGAAIAGDPFAVRTAAEEGRDLADAIGDGSNSRACRFWLGLAQATSGDLAGAVTQFGEVAAESEATHDEMWRVSSIGTRGILLAYQGEAAAARAAGEATLRAGAELGGFFVGMGGRGDDIARSTRLFRPAGHGSVRSRHAGRAADLGAVGRQHHRSVGRSRKPRSGPPGGRRRVRASSAFCSNTSVAQPPRWSCSRAYVDALAQRTDGRDPEEARAALVAMWGTGEAGDKVFFGNSVPNPHQHLPPPRKAPAGRRRRGRTVTLAALVSAGIGSPPK